jgi:N-acetylneuraminic acid mutarotase
MNYYRCCGGSEKVTIDGEKVKDKMELVSQNVNNLILNKDNRVRFYINQVVVYNDVFYFLNGNGLYKSKNGVEWELEAAYPLQTTYVGWQAVVYNDEIHFFCQTYHYKWDGTTWTSVSTLPYSFNNGKAVVYNNDIHILGGNGAPTSHYKWDGTTWTSVSTLPYSFTGAAVVFRNEIHILGGSWGGTGYSHHYKWNGTTWTKAASLPYSDTVLAVVLDDKIHILGGTENENYNQYSNCNKHYEYHDGSWTKLDDIVVTATSSGGSPRIYISGVHGGSAFVHNNKIYVAGYSGGLSGVLENLLGYTCRIINAKVYCQ